MKKLSIVILVGSFIIPAISFASIDINLKYGAQGTEVKELQEFLIDKGFLNGKATGNFFTLTKKAVIAYQNSVGLPATGFVGPMTREKINPELVVDTTTEVQETATVTPLTNNDAVTALQNQINAMLTQLQQLNSKVQTQTTVQQQTKATLEQTQQIIQQQAAIQQQTQQSIQQIQQNITPTPVVTPPATPTAPTSVPAPPLAPSPRLFNVAINVEGARGCYINPMGTGMLATPSCLITVWYREDEKRSNATISVVSKTGTFNTSTVDTTPSSDGQPAAVFVYTPNPELITPMNHVGRWCAQVGASSESVCSDNGGYSYQHPIRIVASANGVTSTESSFVTTTHYPTEPYLEALPSFPITNDPIIIKRKVWQQDQTNTSYPVDVPIYPQGYNGATIANFRISSADEMFRLERIEYESSNKNPGLKFQVGGVTGSATTAVFSDNVWNNPEQPYLIKVLDTKDQVGTHTLTIKNIRVIGKESGEYRYVQGLPVTFHFTVQ